MGCSWWLLVLAQKRGKKSFPRDTETRASRVKSACTRTRVEDAAQHLMLVLCQSRAMSLDQCTAGSTPRAGGAGSGAEGTAGEMLLVEAGTAGKGSREGIKICERGLDLFFSPLPAPGRMFWVCDSLPAVMFTEPVVVVVSGAEICVAF